MTFEAQFFSAATFAGAVASISGFGIGSILTPLLATQTTTKLAISLVSIPHLVATTIRFWMLRKHIDRKLLLSFGSMSAAGGLLGALLHHRFEPGAITLIFGGILVSAGLAGASGLSERMKFHGAGAWIAGGVSGLLGGLVGNQGGIRSAAMLNFSLQRQSFVATATAVGVIVDGARMPVYFWTSYKEILEHSALLACGTLGVVIGTFLGQRLLRFIDEKFFRKLVSLLVFFLGTFMLARYWQLV
ncbi:MAG TPA: sulfite exporter TauE/SafE family protein [Bdellovibrionota bacterium]|jgi:hypothetical protein